jgi:hypothetical protein
LLKDWLLSLLSVAPTYFLFFHTHPWDTLYFVWLCVIKSWFGAFMHVAYSLCMNTFSGLLIGLTVLLSKPLRINTCAFHYASLCFLAYIPCHLNWSWIKNWLFQKAAWTSRLYLVPLHFHYSLAWAWLKIPHKI